MGGSYFKIDIETYQMMILPFAISKIYSGGRIYGIHQNFSMRNKQIVLSDVRYCILCKVVHNFEMFYKQGLIQKN